MWCTSTELRVVFPLQVEFNFRNAQAVISRRLVLLEKQQELLQLSKEKACCDVDTCFDRIIHVRVGREWDGRAGGWVVLGGGVGGDG